MLTMGNFDLYCTMLGTDTHFVFSDFFRAAAVQSRALYKKVINMSFSLYINFRKQWIIFSLKTPLLAIAQATVDILSRMYNLNLSFANSHLHIHTNRDAALHQHYIMSFKFRVSPHSHNGLVLLTMSFDEHSWM